MGNIFILEPVSFRVNSNDMKEPSLVGMCGTLL